MRVFCVVPMYRNLYRAAIDSIVIQTYMPTAVIQINDDCREHLIDEGYINDVLVIRWDRHGRHYASKNIYDAIRYLNAKFHLKYNDLIILVDGDDELLGRVVISEVVKTYHQHGCWLTYGSYINMSELTNKDIKIPKIHRGEYRNGEEFRKMPWRASHLKTFLYGLYAYLSEEEFKDENGEWLRTCSDLALMFPMMEMAGPEKVRHIEQALYIYNDLSELNDHKVSPQDQNKNTAWIRNKIPYMRVKTLKGVNK